MASMRKLKGKWYVRIRYNGKEKLIPTHTGLRRDAEIILRKYQQNEQEVKLKLSEHFLEQNLTINDCAVYFKRNYKTEKGITDSTMKSYNLAVDNFLDCYKHMNTYYELKKSHYSMLVDYLRKRYNDTTVNIRLRSIRTFLNYILDAGYIKELPFKVKQIKTDHRQPKYILPDELEKIYSLVKDEKLLSTFKVYEVTGMRLSELGNSYKEGNFIIVKKTKARKERYIPIPVDYIQHYDYATNNPYSKHWISHCFSAYAKMVCKERKTIHSLRHTFAYKTLMNNDFSIQFVRDLLGHSSVKTTEIYTNIPPEYLKQTYQERLNYSSGLSSLSAQA